ncbi:MAG: hypothetical protein F4164_05310 [Gemmatimonadales bacterium]|nr:hypothetical protein [Gemmatimonadales bacterium]
MRAFSGHSNDAAWRPIAANGPVRLTETGALALRIQPGGEMAFLVYAMAVYRDCIAGKRERWNLSTLLVEPDGKHFARLTNNGSLTFYR